MKNLRRPFKFDKVDSHYDYTRFEYEDNRYY